MLLKRLCRATNQRLVGERHDVEDRVGLNLRTGQRIDERDPFFFFIFLTRPSARDVRHEQLNR